MAGGTQPCRTRRPAVPLQDRKEITRGTVALGGMDRPLLQRGQSVHGALLAPVDTPQGAAAGRVAAMEVPDAERPELVEGEDPVRKAVQDLPDPIQLRNPDPGTPSSSERPDRMCPGAQPWRRKHTTANTGHLR